jgi:hypothetical protein
MKNKKGHHTRDALLKDAQTENLLSASHSARGRKVECDLREKGAQKRSRQRWMRELV